MSVISQTHTLVRWMPKGPLGIEGCHVVAVLCKYVDEICKTACCYKAAPIHLKVSGSEKKTTFSRYNMHHWIGRHLYLTSLVRILSPSLRF